MLRFGLCCIFRNQPIRFRTTTAKNLQRYERNAQLKLLAEICLANSENLLKAIEFAVRNGIGAFRILSPLLPRYTHPDVGYTIDNLPDAEKIYEYFQKIKSVSRHSDIRLSFHPDQFIILASPHSHVVENAQRELAYQGMLAELLGAETINLHIGGSYGDKERTLDRFASVVMGLPEHIKTRLAVENDDTSYTVLDLIPMSRDTGIPIVYDVHHHRCNPDGLSEEEATQLTSVTWQRVGREPYFHISSPRYGWHSKNIKPHADYIDPHDFPDCWKAANATVDVEAKAKELAVLRLMDDLTVN